jgi:hypothetical protein
MKLGRYVCYNLNKILGKFPENPTGAFAAILKKWRPKAVLRHLHANKSRIAQITTKIALIKNKEHTISRIKCYYSFFDQSTPST